MKTTSPGGIPTKDERKRQIRTRRSLNRNRANRAAADVNYNATRSQIEQERDACEEELYRLRFGIENLLNNNGFDGLQFQQQRKFTSTQNPFRTMIGSRSTSRKMASWLDRCCPPCCRRWIRAPPDYRTMYANEYADQNYPPPPRRAQRYSDLMGSRSSLPFVSSHRRGSNITDTSTDLKYSIDKLINDGYRERSNLFIQEDLNDPAYHSLIVKILEAKALDCLCSGYSKQNTQQQIQQALSDLNHRSDRHQDDSVSRTSSQSSALSVQSSSTSSILSEDPSLYSRFETPQLSSQQKPLTLDGTGMNSTLTSPYDSPSKPTKEEDSVKSNDSTESPKESSKVAIAEDKKLKPGKSKKKSRSSSKRRSSSRRKPGQARKRPSKSRKGSKSSTSRKQRKPSSSTKKGSSRPSSRKRRSKKRQPKRSARKKRN